MNNGSEASRNLLFEKTGTTISGVGQAILKSAFKIYDKIENSSLAIKKLIIEKKLILKNAAKNNKNGTWEDNSKKILRAILKKESPESAPIPVEAGILGLLAIKNGADVLELGCGDGFDAKNFFSAKAYHVTAIDSDPDAIKHATTNNYAPNITYKICDFARDMTVGKFDNIVWNRGPEEFSKDTAEKIISGAKIRLLEDGILSGSSNIFKNSGWLNSQADLEKLLFGHFTNVKIKESGCFPGICYFFASEKELRLI